MDVQEIYKSKLTDIDGALALLQDNDNIITGGVGVEPRTMLENLHRIANRVTSINYFNGLGMRPYPFINDPAYKDVFHSDCIFTMAPGRKAHREGLMEIYPGHLHNGAVRWVETHEGRLVCMLAVTPMDRHGYFRIPLCIIHEMEMAHKADLLIVEVNPNLPIVFGDNELHVRDVDCIIEPGAYELPMIDSTVPTEEESLIGSYISELVPDGSCIQLGIGGIPDAAAHALMGKHDLGVHTEMLTNCLVDLVEAGVVTGAKKNKDPGKMVGAFALGNQRLYDMIDQNPGVSLLRGKYVNSPSSIAQIDNFVSINTGMSVDLTGQICSESIGSLHYSGSGGQADTAIGATHSNGGKNIIALRAVKHTKQGDISAINAQLPLGSVVTLSRNEIDYIVTEYGIAMMRGRNVKQRVDNLIAIAHPDYRAELRKDAQKLMLW